VRRDRGGNVRACTTTVVDENCEDCGRVHEARLPLKKRRRQQSGREFRGGCVLRASWGRRVWTYAKDAADNTDGARESSRVPRRRSVQINTTYIYLNVRISCVYLVVRRTIHNIVYINGTYLYIYRDVLSSPPTRQTDLVVVDWCR